MNFSPLVKNREALIGKVPAMSYTGGCFTEWQTGARAQLSQLLGMDGFVPVDPGFVINEKNDKDGYVEYKYTIATEKDFYITSSFLVPASISGKLPLLISLYGDTEDLKAALGEGENTDRDVCVAACKAGYAVLALEARNFDDCPAMKSTRVLLGEDIRASWNACYRATMRASILGRITIGERVWDISRSIDALLANFDFIDESKITLLGNSGGGTLAYYAAAIDTRITAAICSSGIAEWEDSIARVAMCSCNFVPYIANYFKVADIAGLIAPRKLNFLTYSSDYWFPTESLKSVYRSARSLYNAAESDAISLDELSGDPLLHSSIVIPALNKL